MTRPRINSPIALGWDYRRSELIADAVVHATPYMPAHTHGSAEVVVEEQGNGEYRLEPVVLNMPGVWEIAIDVTPPGGESSEALFTFCVPEL